MNIYADCSKRGYEVLEEKLLLPRETLYKAVAPFGAYLYISVLEENKDHLKRSKESVFPSNLLDIGKVFPHKFLILSSKDLTVIEKEVLRSYKLDKGSAENQRIHVVVDYHELTKGFNTTFDLSELCKKLTLTEVSMVNEKIQKETEKLKLAYEKHLEKLQIANREMSVLKEEIYSQMSTLYPLLLESKNGDKIIECRNNLLDCRLKYFNILTEF